MEDKRSSDVFKTSFSFITGAIVGAGLALLFAPATGKETRETVGVKLDEAKEELKKFVDEKVNKALKKTGKEEQTKK